MNYRLALMTGVDIPISEMQLVLHQPSILEISRVGEDEFLQVIHYLCINKESLVMDKNISETMTNFQILLKVIEQTGSEFKSALTSVLSLFFPEFFSAVTPKNILLINRKDAKNVLIIDDSNFEILQPILKDVVCASSLFQEGDTSYRAGNAEAQKIIDKIMKARKKVATLKTKTKESILSRYLSILTIGIPSMSLQDCTNLTMFQLFDLLERFNLYTAWETDLKVKLAGGEPKSEAENWMKNIYEKL